MRVLVITNMYPRDDDPSYGVFIADQLRALREAGVAADLYYIEGYKSRSNYLRAIGDLRARRGAYDLYHAHHVYAAAAAELAGVGPLVVTIHEGAVISRRGYRRLARFVAGRAQARVAVSAPMARALAPIAADVIPIGIDLNLFAGRDRFACRHELGLPQEKKLVLFATNPARPEKRYDLAVAATETAVRRLPALQLLAMPPVSRSTVPVYFGASDVALVTSDFESGPLTVKEAVACGRPVVSRRVGDIEFLEKCPACVVVGDTAAAIAEGIIQATNLRDVDAAAVQPYELGHVTARLISLYRNVLNEKAGHAVG